jgi:hypothetical protein
VRFLLVCESCSHNVVAITCCEAGVVAPLVYLRSTEVRAESIKIRCLKAPCHFAEFPYSGIELFIRLCIWNDADLLCMRHT